MQTVISVIHVMTCILLVLVILIQSGKGAEISASFGGSSQTVFGSSGGSNFFTKFTSVAAVIFMCTSLALTILGGASKKSIFDQTGNPSAIPVNQQQQKAPAAPAAPAPAPAQPAAPANH
jgi:preprotein translocase subunit SecG